MLVIAVIFSIGTAYASDDVSHNETGDILDSQEVNEDLSLNEDGLLSENEISSFTNLSDAIDAADRSIELACDYEFNLETDGDFSDGILIERDDFLIDGNNHVVDAKNNAAMFIIRGDNVTLKNIVLKNSKDVALRIEGSGVITDNVTFMNCGDDNKYGGAVHILNSNFESRNDIFIDNYAKYGSAMFARGSNVTVNNGRFKNSKGIHWSLIYAVDSNLIVEDTVFANMTSKYATALFAQQTYVKIRNSRFYNLSANATAGAVGLKVSPSTIEDCEFVNVSSAKNGGAIFVDIDKFEALVLVNNTLFENCSSNFGGAYLQLAGNCSIVNSTFRNNRAEYDGGAVYVSTVTDINISDSTFTGNLATDNGGAVFIDNSEGSISDSRFTNNHALIADALYLYDSNYILDDLEFSGNGDPIYTYFEETSERKNLYGNDTISEDNYNNTYYPDVIFGPGKQLVFRDNPLNFTVLPSNFSLVDYGLVTPVKNQGSQGSCWAFGIISSLESALLIKTGVAYDFSENNLQDSLLIYSKLGSTDATESGFSALGYAYLLNWLGMLPRDYDEYDELGKISPLLTTGDDIHVQDIVLFQYIPGDSQSIEEIKRAIVEYGALMGSIAFGATAFDEGPSTYNETYCSLYTPEYVPPNHMISVVGWDDNFPKENFTVTPPGDGAWIIKNSWGTEWGDNGYFYISYYDPTFANYDVLGIEGAMVGVRLENDIQYTKNYQYDFIGIFQFSEAENSTFKLTNNYVSYGDDVIAAVGTYFYPDTDYTVEVVVNDSVVYTQNGRSLYYGYHTINLDSYVSIKKGDKFAVTIIVDGFEPISTGSRVKYLPGVSVDEVGPQKVDQSSDGTVSCIKVYTLNEPFTAERIVETYSQNMPFKVNVTWANVEVSISFDDQTMTNMSDENGIVTFNLPLMEHGVHPIHVSCNGSTVISSVTVLSTIDADDEIIVAHDANKNLTVTFYDIDGNALNSMTFPLPNEIGNYTLSFTNHVTGEVRNSTIKVISRFLIHKDLTTCYGARYTVTVAGDDGKPAPEGENVTFEIMGKTAIAETTEMGVAGVFLPYEAVPGTYTITVTYKGESVKHTIVIEHLIHANETVTAYLTDESLTLVSEQYYFNGYGYDYLYDSTITFRLNGKSYIATTDDKGVAKVVVNKNDIKQLKEGKYTVEIVYEQEIFKTTLVVKQPISTDSTVSIKNIDNKLVLNAVLKYDSVAAVGKKITFKFNGKTYTALTDKNGIARLSINKNVVKKLNAGGKYTVTISYMDDVIKSTVKVKKILSAKKTVKVKKSAKKLVLKATLKDGKSLIKNKKITFKFKGKTYGAKTNKKGIAKVTIKKNVIKKLKAGKKYTARISYQNNVVKTIVKVKK